MLLNDGSGIFSEITQTALPISNFRTVGASFFDINKDGYLDLVTGNRMNGAKNIVLINNKNNKFEDYTSEYFPELNSYVFDFVFADFNSDGQQDIYFCNFRGSDILLFKTKN